MKIADPTLKQRFVESTERFMREYGFVFDHELSDKEGIVFQKNTPYPVSYRVTIVINSYLTFFSISVKLYIKSDQIERIRKDFTGTSYLGKLYFTVVASLNRVAQMYDRQELKISPEQFNDEESLREVNAKIESFFTQIGFSFFDRFRALNDFDVWFSKPLLEGTFDRRQGTPWNFAVDGLTAARLNGNPHYEELYQTWLTLLPEDHTNDIAMVKAVKAYLDNLPPDKLQG